MCSFAAAVAASAWPVAFQDGYYSEMREAESSKYSGESYKPVGRFGGDGRVRALPSLGTPPFQAAEADSEPGRENAELPTTSPLGLEAGSIAPWAVRDGWTTLPAAGTPV